MKYDFNKEPVWFHRKIKRAGYRITLPRRIILDVLSKSTDHMSAEDIYIKIHRKYPVIGLTTIYRTLELLVKMGIVSRFDFGDKRARYELSEGPGKQKHHHHLVCRVCGRVIDYTEFIDDEKELLEKTEKGLSEKYGFRIENHIIQFYGLCESCKNT
jgi:Fur family ferric uptake transcriptional regulator